MNASVTPIHTQKKPQDHKNGHQVILKTFIRDKTVIEIEFTDGTVQLGRVTQFDNYTITLMRLVRGRAGYREIKPGMKAPDQALREDGHRTFFKSVIKGFGAYVDV
uniref:RNA-binding protein Hfq n=1 Tax=Pseudomonas phage Nican01 TaxID=3138540 RepID=A0AAU6W1A7_9CAUD